MQRVTTQLSGLTPGVLLIFLASLSACAANPLKARGKSLESSASISSQPGYPLSSAPWRPAKGSELMAWIQREGSSADVYWVCEAYIQLAEEEMHDRNTPSLTAADRQHLAGLWRKALQHSTYPSQSTRIQAKLVELAGPGNSRTSWVVPRWRWNADPARPGFMDRASGSWKYITMHHSALEPYRPQNPSLQASQAEVRRIQQAHIAGNDWGDIGYHFLIDAAGRVYAGRSLIYQGAHASGANNVDNIGICLLGNFQRERPPAAALDSMDQLIRDLRADYGRHRVRGHHDWKSTECPGKHLIPHLRQYQR